MRVPDQALAIHARYSPTALSRSSLHSADSVLGSGGASIAGAEWKRPVRSLQASAWSPATGRRAVRARPAPLFSRLALFGFLRLGGDLLVDERVLDAGDRLQVDVLVRVFHQALPGHRRQRAAGHVAGRVEIVIAQPDGGRVVAGEADIPGVAIALRGAGLAGRADVGKRGAPRRADLRHLHQHRVHLRHRLFRQHALRLRRRRGRSRRTTSPVRVTSCVMPWRVPAKPPLAKML